MSWEIDDNSLFEWISSNVGIRPRTTREMVRCVSDYVNGLGIRFNVEEQLNILRNHESILYLSDKRYRDHVKHACRIAVLGDILLSGTLFNEKSKKETNLITVIGELMKISPSYSQLFQSQTVPLTGESLNKFILRSWYTAALFHDIGFAFEAFLQLTKSISFFEKFEALGKFFKQLDVEVSDLKNDLGAPALNKDSVIHSGKGINHAQVSAMYIQSLEDENDPVLDVASHVVDLHHADNFVAFADEPLGFLLILLDEIQEWGRPIIDRSSIMDAFDLPRPEIGVPSIELAKIALQSDIKDGYAWDIEKHKGKLVLEFALDYDEESDVLLKTGFNFPLWLYSKERALSRLKAGSIGKLQKVLEDSLGISDVKFDVMVDILAKDSLSQEWDRQTRHLYAQADRDNNQALKEWVVKLIKEKGFKFVTKTLPLDVFRVTRPEVGLQKSMRDSFELYMLDREIQDCEVWERVTYKKEKEPDVINTEFTVKRVWKNNSEPKRGIPEASVTLGDVHPEDARNALRHVKINKRGENFKEKVIPVLLPKSEEELVDQLVLIFPFKRLIPEKTDLVGEIEVEYEHRLQLPIGDLEADTYTNMRRLSAGKVTVEVTFDRQLFQNLFTAGISRRANFSEWGRPERNNFMNRVKRKMACGVPQKDLVTFEEASKGKEVRFSQTFENVPTYQTVGWIWIKK